MTEREFLSLVAKYQTEHPEWRPGQTVFNTALITPETGMRANELRGSDVDPFHRNENVPSFIAELFGAEKS